MFNNVIEHHRLVGVLVILLLTILPGQMSSAQELDDTWTVTVNGQSAQVNPDGTFRILNVSSADQFGAAGPGSSPDFLSDDFVRLRGHRTVDGVTQYVFSQPFQIQQGIPFVVGGLTFTETPPPVPASIQISADPDVIALGDTSQLTVTAEIVGGGQLDVSSRDLWTIYRTSNSQIATVDENGLVTSHATGSVYLTAVNEGSAAVKRVTIADDVIATTVIGTVALDDGTPVAGALVSTLFDDTTSTQNDGTFVLPVNVPINESVLVRATALVDGIPYAGTSMLFDPEPGGFTDVGTIMLDEVTTITLTPPDPNEFGGTPEPDGGVVQERGAFITALNTFTIGSLGIEADLLAPELTLVANIYAANGVTRGVLLATASATFADAGVSFYDVPINFTFVSGVDYDIAIDFIPSASLAVRFFNFDPQFASVPFDVNNLVRVVDGESLGGASNFVLAHFRLDGGLEPLRRDGPLTGKKPLSSDNESLAADDNLPVTGEILE